jgi:hypothetical protein
MTKNQEYILWAGLFLLLVYLFADSNVRALLFNKKTAGNTPVQQQNTFLTSLVAGLPSSTGNTHSNTGNSGSVQLA